MQKERLAVIVPYRNREEHLKKFVPHMEQYLRDFDFQIFVIEQGNELLWNKGILMNAGFKEAQNFDYFVFHDVDMLPIDADYSFHADATHLAGCIEEYNWKRPYAYYLGGVIMLSKQAFLKINGMPNQYWGWGREDDEIHDRILLMKVPLLKTEGRYSSLSHATHRIDDLLEINTVVRADLKKRISNGQIREGYSTVPSYKILSKEKLAEHTTLIKITFEQPKRNMAYFKMRIMLTKLRLKLGYIKRAVLGQNR